MNHTCHAIDCRTPCKPEHLMCAKHWAMLSAGRQKRVYEEYRVGQCNGKPPPSQAWHDAADLAIMYVHIRELRQRIRELSEALHEPT